MKRTFLMPALFQLGLILLGSSAGADSNWICRGSAALTDGRAFDAATGNDPRRYPPDPQVDYQHLTLEIFCDDPLSQSFVANETLTFTTVAAPITRLELDAVKLDVRKVTDLEGKNLEFVSDGARVTVQFGRELPPRTAGGLKFVYEAHEPEGSGGGIHFAIPAEGSNRPLQAHSQGESEWNRYWFISHDYPNEKLTSEISITLPAKYVALANGKLVDRKEIEGNRIRWHYSMEQPHSTYLISLVFGEFAVVKDEWRGRPVEYWVPPNREKDARPSLGRTPEMIEWFSKRTGVDYPYAKYSQALVYEFNWGGMENISCTTLVETAILDERARRDQDEDGLVSHELAHQWFGDLVTCRSWPHVWLNEGFATYMEQVWYEHSKGWDDYYYGVWNNMMGVAQNPEDDATGGVVFTAYGSPDDIFGRGNSNPYSKGCSGLHMLHEALGDELFWNSIHEYLTRYSFKNAETDDLRRVVEELSGRSFERFFQQWFYRPGSPAITLDYHWDAQHSRARITATQTQKLTADRPAFQFDLPIWLVTADGKIEKQILSMESKTAELTIPLAAAPTQICVDPRSSILARYVLNVPDPMLIEQARHGPTLVARCAAARLLGTRGDDDAVAALEAILLNEQEHEELRKEAAGALGRRNSDAARDVLIGGLAEDRAIANHHVRRSAIDNLAGYRSPVTVPTLLRYARKDPCYSIEAAATSALGRQARSDEIVAVLTENTKKPSDHDQIRMAAIGALAELNEPAAVTEAMEMSQRIHPQHIRNGALGILGGLGKIESEKKRIYEHLVSLLDEPSERNLPSVIGALGALGNDDAMPALQRIADGAAAGPVKRAAEGALNALRDKGAKTAELKSLQSKISELEQRVKSLADKAGAPEKGE